ncbi:MAG: fibrobacter succinogenes major paralogous domain-containing protein [Fibromonadaceae bacterium]|jgi:uncharacterized protein (TIGR02145 family)|nr:fibrobacter succinogenes major paralogous domain-containing protein [Fibromonadaceae bacterium]
MKKILSLLAISFSLVSAYTAADVYGLWQATGGFNFDEMVIGLDKLIFEKSSFDNGEWRFNNGRITFSNSNNYCVLISAKMMDCQTIRGKITFKKAATDAQIEQMIKQREKERAKQDSIKKWEKLPFYNSLKQVELHLGIIDTDPKYMAIKGDFESTADFNKRKSDIDKKLKDSTASYFKNSLNSVVDAIAEDYKNGFNFRLIKYDADRQMYDVTFTKGDLSINGKVKMPPEVAKNLREELEHGIKTFSFKYENVDLRVVDYTLIPINMNIYDDANRVAYKITFTLPKNAKEIIFRGSELWKDNPYAKNLSVSLAEAIKIYPLVKEAEKKAAEERAAKKAADYEELIKKGFFIDTRDGKKYNAVKIGDQVWMAENLNYNTSDSKCYDNKTENCSKYGRLYNWNMAKAACPNDWHLPSNEEWDILIALVGGEKTAGKFLKATSGWNSEGNGTDAYGFAALPGGNGWFSYSSSFKYIGSNGYWRSDTEKDAVSSYAYGWGMSDNDEKVFNFTDNKDGALLSIRCLLD